MSLAHAEPVRHQAELKRGGEVVVLGGGNVRAVFWGSHAAMLPGLRTLTQSTPTPKRLVGCSSSARRRTTVNARLSAAQCPDATVWTRRGSTAHDAAWWA